MRVCNRHFNGRQPSGLNKNNLTTLYCKMSLLLWGGGGVFAGHYGRLIATTHALHYFSQNFSCSHQQILIRTALYIYLLYSRKISREKTFANFVDLWLFTKVFSVKFGGVVSFSMARASNPRKFSPLKSFFASSLPQKFPTIQYTNNNVSRYKWCHCFFP